MATLVAPEQFQEFAVAWFHALDVHAPSAECQALLAVDGLRMHFPDAEIRDLTGFQKWYDRVTHLFYDEQHTIRGVEVVKAGDSRTEFRLRVRWQSGWWEPPAADSKRIDLEVSQNWVVRHASPDKNTFGLEIVEYVVADDFTYAPGSARLSAARPADRDDLGALNERIGEMEQAGEAAAEFFRALLADRLVFRRANGKIVGKNEPGGFLSSLPKNPFSSRRAEEISVNQVGDRALVTLLVVATRADDGSVHRYRNIRLFGREHGEWILELWYDSSDWPVAVHD